MGWTPIERDDEREPRPRTARRSPAEDRIRARCASLTIGTDNPDTEVVDVDDRSSAVTDAEIRALRDESRAIGDADRVRCCNAALGLPTGDGAGGLLDAAACRARCAAIVENNRSCGLNTYAGDR